MKNPKKLLPKVTANGGKKSGQLNRKRPPVFLKDISANIPSLFEQLAVKDRQIHQLNDTVKILLNKQAHLDQQLQGGVLKERAIGGSGILTKKRTFWQGLVSIPSILLVALIVILVLGLQTFQYWTNIYSANSPAITVASDTESEQYLEVIGRYQDKVTDLEGEVDRKNEQANMLSYTLDTLSQAMVSLTKQLAEKGQKEGELLRLKEELGQKTLELEDLGGMIDSLNYTYILEKERMQQSKDTELLAETFRKLEQAAAQRTGNQGILGSNLFETTNPFLYFVITILFILLIFNTLFKGK